MSPGQTAPSEGDADVTWPGEAPGAAASDAAPLTGRARRFRGPYAVAMLFVAPYFLLMVAWALSNPPGAAPDEADQLVKALGVGRLHIGTTYHATVPDSARPIVKRNASISRVVEVPKRLLPTGYKCTAFKPEQTAACLPTHAPHGSGSVAAVTPIGSYPPFLYLPIGLAAHAASTPTRAFLAGRLACVIMATILLFFGAAHLVRWLGRRALQGAFVALTPMALFASAVVSTSGVEICGAFAMACVGVVAIRRKESLLAPSTMFTLGGSGAALILSRQLGSVTFAAIIVLVVLRVGWRCVWELIRRHSAPFVVAIASLIASLGLIVWWERTYDHPNLTGGVFVRAAVDGFDAAGFKLVREGVGDFGWLDTAVPRWVVTAWVMLAVVLVGAAILFGSAADRWSLVAWLVAIVVLAYVTYATVFFPIHAGLQARHLLPFFMLAPLLAGTVFVESLEPLAPHVVRRVFYLTAVVMPTIQFMSLYFNARRYAVGIGHSFDFLGSSKWSPKFGWAPWLTLGLIAAVGLVYVIAASAPGRDATNERTPHSVER